MLAARVLTLYGTSVGKKMVMALSGFVLVGFVIGHLAGNLQIFLGREALDSYSQFLHSKPTLLWGARIGLLLAVFAHIASAIPLARQKYKARPIGYAKRRYVAANYASRTMYWSGPIVLAFIIYHLLHFTFGSAHPDFRPSVYHNVVVGFSNWYVSGFYIVAQVMLGFHLYHGIWSMFQTLGLNNEQWDGRLRNASRIISALLVVGNVSIPVAVLAGVVHL